MASITDAPTPIPLTRLDNADPELMAELIDAVVGVAQRAAFIGGSEVEAFEAEWAAYCGTEHAVGVSSGTEALVLALRALEIGPGDEVIVPANSFIATAEAVSLVGATPRLVDVDPETALITAAQVEAAITDRTRAVIPVHLYGRTVNLGPILAVARAAGIAVVEDACQAHGAHVAGRRAGAVGDCGAFSFYPAKNLGAWGDGGALVTHDPDIADRVRLLRSHGERPRYHHRLPGTTARLDAIQAAVLRIKLRRLEGWNDARRLAGSALIAALEGAPVQTPASIADGGDHVFHQFVVRTSRRDALRAHLERLGISTGIHYPVPIHRTDAYAALRVAPLPVSEALAASSCSLPFGPTLSGGELERIAEAIHRFAN